MRTSHLQYVMMVEFMEENGDLSKPSGGPRGLHFIHIKWKELTNKLNSDGTGDPKSEEKWRKVWSDYKNNCKKKYAIINRAASGTGGGPALQLCLTDLENRVMQIIGVQAATGMVMEESGFQQVAVIDTETDQTLPKEPVPEASLNFEELMNWNTPGTTSQPTVAPPSPPTIAQPSSIAHPPSPPVAAAEETWKPPRKKFKKNIDSHAAKLFIDSENHTREYARERDRVYEEFEKERLRLKDVELTVREYEVQERVRQRDMELQLQGALIDCMKQAMVVFVRYMDKKS